MPGYPIELDLTGRTALVVGFGAVGRRKVAGLLAAGARVRVVDPSAQAGEAPEGVELRAEAYRAEHLDGVVIAVAAGPPGVNRRVVDDAKAAGVWVASASEPGEGNFVLPAVWRSGGLTLTVSTSGASPALASALRDRAAGALGEAASGLASAFAGLRPDVLARLDDPGARRRVLADWGDPRWLALWADGGDRAVRDEVERALAREEARGRGEGPGSC